jgi:MFS transporter, PHS family, inorganic phosphate transporter
MGYVYYPDTGVLPTNVDLAIKMSSSVGTIIGQIGFGVLNDMYGRKRVLARLSAESEMLIMRL